MANVDDRIVEMKFVNERFEQKLSETIRSLDGLKRSLDFANAKRSLEDLNRAGNSLDMSKTKTQLDFTKSKQNIEDLGRGTATSFQNMKTQMDMSKTASNMEDFGRRTGGVLERVKGLFNFDKARTSIEDVGRAAGRFTMAPMGQAVSGVMGQFSALQVMAVTALGTITHQAVISGQQIAKSLTIGPLMQGFQEYETNMNSIQTVLANTKDAGTSLNDVNAALDKLNHYSDQTIYNFSEMARNIGTFTAAGVDLDTSVNSIKGIANLAAISGSSSAQASTAMYQLSQALAAGKVSLMDWNSVVNAGMGGEVFKKALFETGKAMKTITDVPLGASFEEWEKKGGTFREQMQKGWITADVLSTTLESFSGDLDEAGLRQLGFSEAAAKKMIELGKMGQAAATEVKTFSQLMSTVKESIASGWSQTFRTIVGDFEGAKKLFTEINNVIGGFIGRSADARNAMFKGWADMGGREALIQGLRNVFEGLLTIINPIREAFRDIFPPMTTERLLKMTASFVDFTEKLRIGEGAAGKIKDIFRGLFAVLEIGWEVIKQGVGFIGDLIGMLAPAAGDAVDFAQNTGDALTNLNKALVGGGGIREFFEKLRDAIKEPAEFVGRLKDTILDFIDSFGKKSAVVGDAAKQMSGPFQKLRDAADTAGGRIQWFIDKIKALGDILWSTLEIIGQFARDVVSKVVNLFTPEDFDPAIDAINVGLLGGIALLLKKFIDNGFKIDLGQFDVIDTIKEGLGELTNTLKAMQAELKARALRSIAIAIAILAGAVLVFSLVDPEALAKALIAMAVGFGQLITVMFLIDKISMGAGAAKLSGLAIGMGILAAAAVILSIAIKNLSGLSWEELAKGLAGVAGAMLVMVGAVKLMSGHAGGMITAGIGLVAISVGMLIMSKAVESFAGMDWEEMGRGLAGLAGSLIAVTAAMRLMPIGSTLAAGIAMIPLAIGITMLAGAVKLFSMMSWEEMAQGLVGIAGALGIIGFTMGRMPLTLPVSAAGIVILAVGLNILAGAVMLFSTMDWDDMARGLVGIGAALVIIGLAMGLMPLNLPITAAGMVILSVALTIMAGAVKLMASMDIESLAKGLGALAVMMLILVVAVNAMTGAIVGAAALLVVSASLVVLAGVLKTLGSMSIGEILTGLGALAGLLAVLGIAALLMTPVIPALMGLGIALAIVGGAMALFGIGVAFLADGIATMAKAGKTGVEAFSAILVEAVQIIPKFIGGIVKGLAGAVKTILEVIPMLARVFKEIFLSLLDVIIKVVPKIVEAFSVIVTEILKFLRDKLPDFIELGFEVVMALLKGIRDNIEDIVNVVADIFTGIFDALSERVPEMVESVYNFMMTVVTEVARKLGEHSTAFIPVGQAFIDGLITGLVTNLANLLDFFIQLPGKILKIIKDALGINSPSTVFKALGGDIITGFLNGLVETVVKVMTFFIELPGKILGWIGDLARTLWDKGIGLIGGFLGGIVEKGAAVITWFTELPGKIKNFFVNALDWLVDAGGKVIDGLLNGIKYAVEAVKRWFREIPGRIIGAIPNPLDMLWDVGKKILKGLQNGMEAGWEKAKDWLTGLNPATWFNDINPYKGHAIKNLVPVGKQVMQGLQNGMETGWGQAAKWLRSLNPAEEVKSIEDAFVNTFGRGSFHIPEIEDGGPVITPVLDLDQVIRDARAIGGFFDHHIIDITPGVSIERAQHVMTTAEQALARDIERNVAEQGIGDVTFIQNNYSPEALSTNDIYRSTKSQIALAKEELGI